MSRRHHTLRTRLVAALLGSAAGLALTACGSGQITQTDVQASAVDGVSGEVGGMAIRNATLAFPAAEETHGTPGEQTHGTAGEQADAAGHETEPLVNSYPRGSDVPLVATFVNSGKVADELVAVRTTAARTVEIDGPARFEPKSAVTTTDEMPAAAPAVPEPSASSSAPGSTSASPGESASEAASETAAAGESAAASGSASAAPDSETAAAGVAESEPAAPTASEAPAPPAGAEQLRVVLTDTTEPIRAGIPVEVTFVFAEAGELTLEVPMGTPEGRGEFSVPAGLGPAQIAKIERLEEQLSGKVEDEAIEHWAEENGLDHAAVEEVRKQRGDGDDAEAEHSAPTEGGSGGH